MCLVQSNILGIQKWNWDGDIIIHDSTVPSSRPVVGLPPEKKNQYEIDVREFLVSENNSIMQKTIRETIPEYLRSFVGGDADLFQSRKETAFDYRAFVIASYVAEKIAYSEKDGSDPWQFPDETLHIKKGDCEDRTFLLASLLLAAGISPYNIRVALGSVCYTTDDQQQKYDHAWVMYKNECGQWTLIEPLNLYHSSGKARGPATGNRKDFKLSTSTAEYRPYFVFNDSHLWALVQKDKTRTFQNHVSVRRKWSKFKPTFAGEVHKTIINAALSGADPRVVDGLNRYFSRAVLGIFGPLVDDIDRRSYNPLDHFDNSFIPEGWQLVNQRLANFKQNNLPNLDSFALAAHGIADFYAHTSYAHFSSLIQHPTNAEYDYALLYDDTNPTFALQPDYTSLAQFDLTTEKFTVNNKYWDLRKRGRAEIAATWQGKLISGRYAQSKDTWPSVIGQITEGPARIPEQYLSRPDFYKRAGVPHHNEIAVDEAAMSGTHKLYLSGNSSRTDRMNFGNQFRWRKNAAIRHIRQAFERNWMMSGLKLTPLP